MVITRNKAIKRGLKQFEGKICRNHPRANGHRQTSNGVCVVCRKERHDKWKRQHPEYMSARLRQWSIKNRKKLNAKKRTEEYRAKRRLPSYRKRVQRYLKFRRENDVNFHLRQILKSRLNNAIRYHNGKKSKTTIELIGCSIPELKRHLSRQFKKGMTWKNRGKWHIDHKRPCASFDLTKPNQQKKCFHWSNLQPMWARQNIQKGGRYAS